jgi:hypothetical protein
MSRVWLALLLAPVAAFAREPDFYAESADMRAPPNEIVGAVLASESFAFGSVTGEPCSYEGKQLDLDGDGVAKDWALTTKNACGWAASAAPLWLVRVDASGPRVVLKFISYSLTLGATKAHGMRHVATSRSTASRTEEQLWKFDGHAYQITRNGVTPNQE